ncbi:MFS general substrate transporter [Myriangium duriaei CBS 260.36]|uniref:MFS general substrate transporter n=1 Tax=Myriangium duriaei CBS 260.36 TaxID=1168546 RepID=A0A9P4J1G4_9PEZI|nr:MFS general substrate transporter [Myriangium duriaei CBS 260.36]
MSPPVEHDSPEYDLQPGTVYLVSTHDGGPTSNDILLVPEPSDDPRDPLRWGQWRKRYHLLLLVMYSSLLGALTNWEASIYLNLVQALNTTINQLNNGNAVLILMLGIGNVFLIPLSNKLGRRCIYISTLVLVLVAQIIMNFATTAGAYQVSHVMTGIGAAPFEAMVAISIDDTFFVHEKSGALGAYVFGLSFGSFIGPICSGYMSTNQGWRWVYRWGIILTAGLLVIFYFTFEETRFVRSPGMRDDSAAIDAFSEDNGAETINADHDDSKAYRKVPHELDKHLTHEARVGEVFETTTFSIQYKLWQVFPDKWSDINAQFWKPVSTSIIPAVIWCGLNYGTCVSWLSVMATTVAEVLSVPPYNFNNDQLGWVWISPMIGSLFGAYFAGPITDRMILMLTRRNYGYREPEFRLWTFLPSAIIMPAGLMLYGLGAAHGLHWIVPVIGMGFVGFGLSIGGAGTIGYILDCYPLLTGQCVTTIILIRNCIGGAMTFGIQPWIDGMGLQNTFALIGVLSFVVTIFAVVFIAFGKRVRRWTTARYLRLAETFI